MFVSFHDSVTKSEFCDKNLKLKNVKKSCQGRGTGVGMVLAFGPLNNSDHSHILQEKSPPNIHTSLIYIQNIIVLAYTYVIHISIHVNVDVYLYGQLSYCRAHFEHQ